MPKRPHKYEYECSPELLNMARGLYEDDDCEIDDDAKCSPSEEGNWVQAWVWIPSDEDAQDSGPENKDLDLSAAHD